MIPEKDLRISLKESSLRGKKIIAKQPEISYAQALEQVPRVRRISKVSPLLKRSRPNS